MIDLNFFIKTLKKTSSICICITKEPLRVSQSFTVLLFQYFVRQGDVQYGLASVHAEEKI